MSTEGAIAALCIIALFVFLRWGRAPSSGGGVHLNPRPKTPKPPPPKQAPMPMRGYQFPAVHMECLICSEPECPKRARRRYRAYAAWVNPSLGIEWDPAYPNADRDNAL